MAGHEHIQLLPAITTTAVDEIKLKRKAGDVDGLAKLKMELGNAVTLADMQSANIAKTARHMPAGGGRAGY